MAQPAMATQPLRKLISVVQSDGTRLPVYRRGNGHFGYFATEDGLAVVRGADRTLYYAEATADGTLVPSARIAHAPALRSAGEQAYVRTEALADGKAWTLLSARQQRTRGNAVRATTADEGIRPYGTPSTGVVTSIGAPVIPLIMVQFADRKFLSTTTVDKVTRSRNERGYADEAGCAGSVRDYFEAQSGGLFSPTFDVVAVVTLSKNYAYYGRDSGNNIDVNCAEMIREAATLAAAQGVDFSQYATNGKVPLLSIMHAGPGEHSAEDDDADNYIWAHFSDYINVTVGGVKISSYFVGNETISEYSYSDGTATPVATYFDGIGVFCHEFGHALGLPDFYDTENKEGTKTPDLWSVMDYGQYYQNGYAPVGYMAYERAFMGWQKVVDLDETAQFCTLQPFGAEGNTAYRIANPANTKEYFLLENRQPGTWYPSSMGHGLLVTHVDYDATRWYYNDLNTVQSHLRFTVVPADNVWQAFDYTSSIWRGFQGDLFPGTLKNTEFSSASRPASTVFTGSTLDRPVYNIAETNGVVTFAYLDRNLTGIAGVAADAAGASVEVYGVDGRKVGTGRSLEQLQLRPGLYIVKSGDTTRKIQVR